MKNTKDFEERTDYTEEEHHKGECSHYIHTCHWCWMNWEIARQMDKED